jgi:hypothetical protein
MPGIHSTAMPRVSSGDSLAACIPAPISCPLAVRGAVANTDTQIGTDAFNSAAEKQLREWQPDGLLRSSKLSVQHVRSVEVAAMADGMQDRQQVRRGWRVAAAVAAAAAALGSVGVAQASPRSTASGLSAAGGSGAPAGWAPVPYRRAQLSVPGLWLVETPGQVSCYPRSKGMIFAGSRPRIPKSVRGCRLTASLAWIVPAGHIPQGITHRKPTAVIHGLRVYRLAAAPGSVRYLVPGLGVRVGARGPLARRVLATLARSPLSVVLGRGSSGPVPARWVWRRFGGVRFAVPRSWRLQRQHQWATCGTGIVPRSLLLIDATRPPVALPCPYPFPTAADEQGQPGLSVVTGKYAAKSVGEHFARCLVRRGERICLSSVTGQGGFTGGALIFSVSRPHQHGASFFLLGLSGSGTLARAIFGSIRAVG